MRPTTGKTITLIFTFLSVWLFARLLLPLFSPFLAGLLLALAAEPLVRCLHRRAHMGRTLSAAVGVTMAFFLLALGILLLCALMLRQLRAIGAVLPDLEATARTGIQSLHTWLLDLCAHSPESLQPLLRENLTALFSDGQSLLTRLTGYLLSLAGSLLSHVPDSALGLGTALISGYMISLRLPRLRRYFRRRIPREKLEALLAAAKRLRHTLFSWLLAQCKLGAVTFGILAAGFALLRIPQAILWAALICLVDAFPVLGTGTILIPWSFLAFLQGDGPRALGILGIYVTAAVTRSALEPRLLSRHLGLDPLLTLMALYVGFRLWGIPGLLLAPMLTVAALQLLPQRT